MNISQLGLATTVVALSLGAFACGGGGTTDAGTGGTSTGGDAASGGTGSGGDPSGGTSSGGTSSGGAATGGSAGSVYCAPEGGIKPIPESCGGEDSYALTSPAIAGTNIAVVVKAAAGGTVKVSLENEICSATPTVIHSGSLNPGENCLDLKSPGDFTRLRIDVESSGGLSYNLCPGGACATK